MCSRARLEPLKLAMMLPPGIAVGCNAPASLSICPSGKVRGLFSELPATRAVLLPPVLCHLSHAAGHIPLASIAQAVCTLRRLASAQAHCSNAGAPRSTAWATWCATASPPLRRLAMYWSGCHEQTPPCHAHKHTFRSQLQPVAHTHATLWVTLASGVVLADEPRPLRMHLRGHCQLCWVSEAGPSCAMSRPSIRGHWGRAVWPGHYESRPSTRGHWGRAVGPGHSKSRPSSRGH